MAFKACALTKEVTTTSGASPSSIALGGSVSGWNAFSATLSNGDTTVVTIHASDGGKATLGVTYVSATNSLTIDAVIDSTNGGLMINLPSGTHTVFGDFGSDGVERAYSAAQLNAANTWTATQTLKDVIETIHTITDGPSVDIDPANGTIQVWTLGAARTPTATNFAAGQSVTLMLAAGAYTVTWTSTGIVWTSGSAPVPATSGYSVIVLWKVNSTLYGTHWGDVA